MKKVLIVGASGFIGGELISGLEGYEINTLRGRSITGKSIDELSRALEGNDVVINLAGKSLFTLWTASNKKKIYNSRIDTTKKIAAVINTMKNPPGHFINASAQGIYKPETPSSEESTGFDNGFLANVVKDWEEQAFSVNNNKTRTTVLRFGIVLGKDGGAYKILRALTRFNLGAYFGKGEQSLSFIHIEELVTILRFIIEKKIEGPVNIVSPETTNYKTLMKEMKKQLGAFLIWSIPPFIPRIFVGEASEMLLKGQIVIPEVLLKNNYNFEVSDIYSCINKLEGN